MISGAIGSVGTPLNSGAIDSAGTSPVIVMGDAGRADVVDVAVQTDISLPQRVDAYWHCCPSSMTIGNRSRSDNGRDCGMIDTETMDELRDVCEDTS